MDNVRVDDDPFVGNAIWLKYVGANANKVRHGKPARTTKEPSRI